MLRNGDTKDVGVNKPSEFRPCHMRWGALYMLQQGQKSTLAIGRQGIPQSHTAREISRNRFVGRGKPREVYGENIFCLYRSDTCQLNSAGQQFRQTIGGGAYRKQKVFWDSADWKIHLRICDKTGPWYLSKSNQTHSRILE